MRNYMKHFLKKRTKRRKTGYKTYRTMFEAIKKKTKKKLLLTKIIEHKGDARKTWNFMKKLVGKTRKSELHLLSCL